MKEHFRDDQRGRTRAMRFLPWHLGFFWRYRPLPRGEFDEMSMEHPLMQTRIPAETDLPLLERVLRDPREALHERMADALWDAHTDDAAVAAFRGIGEELPPIEGEGKEIATSTG